MKYIGLSLSLCVKDILNGKVWIDDVAGLIASTKVTNEEDALAVFLAYSRSYWAEFHVRDIANVVTKIRDIPSIQPRTIGGEAFNVCDGHWMEAKDDMITLIGMSVETLQKYVDGASKISF